MKMWLKCLTFLMLVTLSVQRSVLIVNERKTDDTRNRSLITPGNFTILVRSNDLTNCTCDSRYNVYYEAKGCRPAQFDTCNCPVKYVCEDINEIEEEGDRACHYQGKSYSVEAQIFTNNPCEQCYCSEEFVVVCTLEKCPQTSSESSENCFDIYEADQCCPTNTTCIEDEEEYMKSGSACIYNNRTYPLGTRMYSKEDPCEVCMCTEEWINSNGTDSNCYQTHCVLEKYKSLLLKGCAPIYQEDTCCPTDFYCAPDEEFFRDTQTIEPDVDLKCNFFGKNYHVGDSVSISQGDSCLLCTCQVPPDLTCEQQMCKPNPNEETCYPYYTSGGGCCPHYECLMNDGSHESVSGRMQPLSKREMEDEEEEGPVVPSAGNLETSCSEVPCDGGSICVLFLVNCGNRSCLPVPTCIPNNSSCPVCDDGCVVTHLDSSSCPVYVCGDNIGKHNKSLKCDMPNCTDPSCLIVLGADGCPSCSCAGPCPELECREGCNVVTEIEGRCPKCVCEDETEGCPTPVCENEGCRIEKLPNGCPTCVCRSSKMLNCDIPNCTDPNCLIVLGSDGCPFCSCAGPCPELKCREGCNVITEIEGSCPKCVCEDETEGCPTPVCENEGCRIENLPNGCPTCICGNTNSGRELEEAASVNQDPIQQQQQTSQNGAEMEVGYPSEWASQGGDDYDDTIVVFSSSSSSQNSNMEERPDYYDSESKQLTNSIPESSPNFRSRVQVRRNRGEVGDLFIFKPMRGMDRLKPEP